MAIMQLGSIELEVLGVIAKIELISGRMARFDDAENRSACKTLDELGLVAITDSKAMTIACMRDDGRTELEERGFYQGRPHS